MYLKHLTINGFKSFAKKSELEFSAPITAIVGPNGSGKSNVAEAFRFVLGEQSLKSMRGKRGEDLIFSGTQAISRGNRAAVQVTLDNSKRVFSLDYDEITVERTVHRDGQNEYTINGSKVRLKDVHELLAAANIGTTGHHIISQGEADRVLTANPRERREMIEDALGLKVFQYKKQEAEKKLTKTKTNIEAVQTLRKEVAPHLAFLERQIKKIERAVQLRAELSTTYAEYLKREDTYVAHHYDRLRTEQKKPEAELKKIQADLEAAKATVATATKDTKQSEEIAALQTAVTKVQNERQELEREIGRTEGQITYCSERVRRLQSQADSVDEVPIPRRDVKKLIEAVEKDATAALQKDDESKFKRVLQDVVQTLQTFAHKVLAEAVVDTSKEEKEQAALEKELQMLQQRMESVQTKETAAIAALQAKQAAVADLQSAEHEAERTMFRLQQEEQTCQQELFRITTELDALERDRDEFKRELQEAVTLLGREAGRYFEHEVQVDGEQLDTATIVKEARSAQRDRRRELEKLKIRLEEVGGVDQDIEKEYKDVKERDEFLVKEIADLEASVASLEELITDLNTQLNEQFLEGIKKIDVEFKKFFQLMFGGGNAALERVAPKKTASDTDADGDDEEEEKEEGVEIDVALPNKRVRGLDMLSGGERALTSIALIFAMSQVNPPLFIILDETDAALDEANSRRYGDMIEALAEKSQLILITHNRETMSRAGILYGVTMGGEGVSKLLSVKFDEAAAVAK